MRQDLTSNDGEEIDVKKFIRHPSYNDDTLDFNYALLVLERTTTQDIKLIRLNSDEVVHSSLLVHLPIKMSKSALHPL
jgi:secreted trypsin-like serine protease